MLEMLPLRLCVSLFLQPAAAAQAEDEDIFGDAGTDYKPSVDPTKKRKPQVCFFLLLLSVQRGFCTMWILCSC